MQILKKRQIYRLTSEESGGRLLSAWGMETRASLVMLDRTKSFSSTSRQYQAISIPSRPKKSGSIEADAFRVPWNTMNKPNVVSLTKIGKLIFWADNVYFYNIVQKNTIKIHCFNSNLNDSWYSIICSDLIYTIVYIVTWHLRALLLVAERDLLKKTTTQMTLNPRQITTADLFFFLYASTILQ